MAVTGTVGGDVEDGDTVTLTVNGADLYRQVSGGTFSIDVAGSDLLADTDTTVAASVTTTDAAGNTPRRRTTRPTVSTPRAASITLDAITTDNVLNAAEAAATVAVTGTVGGDVQDGDTVTLTVNGVDLYRQVSGSTFSIDVAGSDLLADADTTVDASVTTTDAAGNTSTATDDQPYTRRHHRAASITLDAITTDNSSMRPRPRTVAVTGTVGGDVQDGDTVTLTVNGADLYRPGLRHTFSINVAGSDLLADTDTTVAASVTTTDAAGNTATATDDQLYTYRHHRGGEHHARRHHRRQRPQCDRGRRHRGGDRHGRRRRRDDDPVTVTVNGVAYQGTVSSGLTFSIDVAGQRPLSPTQT